MAEHSAGILLFRRHAQGLEVLLVHPGGPFWRNRDAGAWQIPKGGIDAGETPLEAARREFAEELGQALKTEGARALPRIRQAGGKWVDAYAIEGEFDPADLRSVTFELEWPPRSGKMQTFPEVDQAAWFSVEEARVKILASQQSLLDALIDLYG
jgi:predicted NUDIX family NTP pyrophosphohydrolase